MQVHTFTYRTSSTVCKSITRFSPTDNHIASLTRNMLLKRKPGAEIVPALYAIHQIIADWNKNRMWYADLSTGLPFYRCCSLYCAVAR